MARNGNLHSIARLIAREARAVPRTRPCGATWFGHESTALEGYTCLRRKGHKGKHCSLDDTSRTRIWWEPDPGPPYPR